MGDEIDAAQSAQERHLRAAITRVTGRPPREIVIPDPHHDDPAPADQTKGRKG